MIRIKPKDIPIIREQIASIQGNLCAICQTKLEEKCLDHDHKTGKIRDLLCNNCNAGLGKFQDNPELLIKAADYLKEHNG